MWYVDGMYICTYTHTLNTLQSGARLRLANTMFAHNTVYLGIHVYIPVVSCIALQCYSHADFTLDICSQADFHYNLFAILQKKREKTFCMVAVFHQCTPPPQYYNKETSLTSFMGSFSPQQPQKPPDGTEEISRLLDNTEMNTGPCASCVSIINGCIIDSIVLILQHHAIYGCICYRAKHVCYVRIRYNNSIQLVCTMWAVLYPLPQFLLLNVHSVYLIHTQRESGYEAERDTKAVYT